MGLDDTLRTLIDKGKYILPFGADTLGSGYNSQLQPEFLAWRLEAIATIERLGSQETLDAITNDPGRYFTKDSVRNILGCLLGASAIAKDKSDYPGQTVDKGDGMERPLSSKVFVVHGHDRALKSETARLLENLDLQPIILGEQPGMGMTLIEKLESYSDVGFAVVHLTADDVGRAKNEKDLKPRARQNVILELGFLMAKLARPHVVALYQDDVELPSDYKGVEYIKADDGGAWKLKLAKELQAAGYTVDVNKTI